METITVRGDRLMLDAILAKAFDPQMARSMLSTVLDLNPGLAGQGPFLVPGTVIRLPQVTEPKRAAVRVVDLFGG